MLKRLLPICLLMTVLPESGWAGEISVKEFRQLNPKSGTHSISAFVVRQHPCGICPPGAQCKPCISTIVLADDKEMLLEDLKSGVVVIETEHPERFALGAKNSFRVQVKDSVTNDAGHNDLELVTTPDAE